MTTEVTIMTTMGAITLELYTQHAPKTCSNFTRLIERGYYNGCPVRLRAAIICSSQLEEAES